MNARREMTWSDNILWEGMIFVKSCVEVRRLSLKHIHTFIPRVTYIAFRLAVALMLLAEAPP